MHAKTNSQAIICMFSYDLAMRAKTEYGMEKVNLVMGEGKKKRETKREYT